MSKLLTSEEIEKELAELDVEWTVVGGSVLNRVYEFDGFMPGLEFVKQVAEKAEAANHHPDVKLSWGKVEIDLTTHSENGLTKKDFELASQI